MCEGWGGGGLDREGGDSRLTTLVVREALGKAQPGCVGSVNNKKEAIAAGLGVLISSLKNSVSFQGKRKGERAKTDEDPIRSGLFQGKSRKADISRRGVGYVMASWQSPEHAAA